MGGQSQNIDLWRRVILHVEEGRKGRGGDGERQWETLASEKEAEVDHVAVNSPGWAVLSSPLWLSVKSRPFLGPFSAAFDGFDRTVSPSWDLLSFPDITLPWFFHPFS